VFPTGRLTTLWLFAATALLLAACTTPQPNAQPQRPATGGSQNDRVKSIVIGIANDIAVMPPSGSNTTSGGWQSVNELYAQGLVTSDRDVRRPVPRLAAQIPTFEAGTIEMLADGRMRTTYPLRTDVTWHDGQPFTAQDLMFSFELAKDPQVPHLSVEAINVMDSVEAPDDHTFVITWKRPYYLADSVGLRAFFPLPRHILENSYRTVDPLAFTNLPYWTNQYVHLGPFRLLEFKPGEEIIFGSYEGYFLGKPKLDRVIVRGFNDENVLYSAVLAGAVDMVMDNSLSADDGLELKDAWDANGGGTVYLGVGTTRFLAPQFDPAIQVTPALLDPQVRQAVIYSLDRASISEVIQHGHREFIANSILPPGDRMYDAVKDGLAR
jgi:peptide/nickel transport system substrate-binding protein